MLHAGVIGQVVVDKVVRDVRYRPGTTAQDSTVRIGGKGFNLAVALARLGCDVEVVSAVGADDDGDAALSTLRDEGVGVRYLRRCALERGTNIPTPRLMLTEGRYGERVVDLELDKRIYRCYEAALSGAADEAFDVLFFTLELPDDLLPVASETVRDIAGRNRCLIVGNPAPRPEHVGVERFELLRSADILTPNRFEAAALTRATDGTELTTATAHRVNQIFGSRETYVTLGAAGWVWAIDTPQASDGSGCLPPGNVIDKVGASDVFTAVLGCARFFGIPPEPASFVAGLAAKFAVERTGGAEAFPTRTELAEAIRSQGADTQLERFLTAEATR